MVVVVWHALGLGCEVGEREGVGGDGGGEMQSEVCFADVFPIWDDTSGCLVRGMFASPPRDKFFILFIHAQS